MLPPILCSYTNTRRLQLRHVHKKPFLQCRGQLWGLQTECQPTSQVKVSQMQLLKLYKDQPLVCRVDLPLLRAAGGAFAPFVAAFLPAAAPLAAPLPRLTGCCFCSSSSCCCSWSSSIATSPSPSSTCAALLRPCLPVRAFFPAGPLPSSCPASAPPSSPRARAANGDSPLLPPAWYPPPLLPPPAWPFTAGSAAAATGLLPRFTGAGLEASAAAAAANVSCCCFACRCCCLPTGCAFCLPLRPRCCCCCCGWLSPSSSSSTPAASPPEPADPPALSAAAAPSSKSRGAVARCLSCCCCRRICCRRVSWSAFCAEGGASSARSSQHNSKAEMSFAAVLQPTGHTEHTGRLHHAAGASMHSEPTPTPASTQGPETTNPSHPRPPSFPSQGTHLIPNHHPHCQQLQPCPAHAPCSWAYCHQQHQQQHVSASPAVLHHPPPHSPALLAEQALPCACCPCRQLLPALLACFCPCLPLGLLLR